MTSPLSPIAEVEIPSVLYVEIVRGPRARCPRCRLRRVVYRVFVSTNASGAYSEPRCAECWGIHDRLTPGPVVRSVSAMQQTHDA